VLKLSDLIPSPSTRAWLRQLYAVNPEAAGEVAWAIHEGVLEDMGYVKPRVEGETYAHTHDHYGRKYLVNQDTGKCWFCGRIVYADGREEVTGQMSFESQAQMEMC
jgi:hypothetical protein